MPDDLYRLIDFGDGRKLESICGRLVDRPSPAAEHARRNQPSIWKQADSRFCSDAKSWTHRTPWPDATIIDCGAFRMPVRPTPFGHIGLFPEQHSNWQWLNNDDADDPNNSNLNPGSSEPSPKSGLNLFGYTGGSTMALVAAGFQVAHVDAAKPNVQSARESAEINGWTDRPIRYLVDDAATFAAREVRRKKTYDTIVLDPPAYGHSPKGKAWRLQRDLWPLLTDCLSLVDPTNFRMLITGHSPDVTANDVSDFVRREQGRFQQSRREDGQPTKAAPNPLRIESGRSFLKDESGRKLDTGFFVRAQCRLDS